MVSAIVIIVLIAIIGTVVYTTSLSKRPCPHCHTMMPKKVTECPHCHKSVSLRY